jgi:hypothetical protein
MLLVGATMIKSEMGQDGVRRSNITQINAELDG